MKLFIILSRFPFPLEKGDKLRAYHQIKELSKKHTIYLEAISDQPIKEEWIIELKKYCIEVTVHRIYKPFIWLRVFIELFKHKPLQVAYFNSYKVKRAIHKKIQVVKPDHIYCQLIRTTELVKAIQHIPKTVDYMDALSKGWLRQSEDMKGFMKKIYLSEARRLAAYENRIFDYFNHHTIISNQDKNSIQHPQKHKIEIVKNGVDDYFLSYQRNLKETPKYQCVFVGNMSYEPNVRCAEYIAHEIVPLLNLNYKILIAGANPSARVQALQSERITVTGWIDDIRTAYTNAEVFIAPLFIGTGLQNKLLEAMALNIPCITTPLVNASLEARPDKDILIANSALEFVKHVEFLLINQLEKKNLIESANQFVKDQYSWESSTLILNDLIETN